MNEETKAVAKEAYERTFGRYESLLKLVLWFSLLSGVLSLL